VGDQPGGWQTLAMAYRFEAGEPLSDAVRRVVTEEVDAAVASLAVVAATADPAAVHDVRKRTKKLRAVCSLVAGAVSKRRRRRVEQACAEAARGLAAARDAEVLGHAANELIGWADATAAPDGHPVAVVGRSEGPSAVAPDALDDAAQHASWLLTGVAGEMTGWPLANGFAAVADGLGDTYRDGRRRYRSLRGTTGHLDADAAHQWRKRVKHRWYHARLLTAVAPDALGAEVVLLDELGGILGSDHDLAVLVEALADDPAGWGGTANAVDLARLAEARRAELAGRALELGRQLYVDGTKVHVARMAAWWSGVH